jgi:hypothetical protein
MAVQLEARAYGEDSTPDEIAAIRGRISVYRAPNILMYFEVPVPSPFQIKLFSERLNELSAGLERYDLIIDLTIAKPPNAAVREGLKQLFKGQTKLRRAAVFTGRNFMLNVAARFVLGSIGLPEFSVDKTLEEALKSLER